MSSFKRTRGVPLKCEGIGTKDKNEGSDTYYSKEKTDASKDCVY